MDASFAFFERVDDAEPTHEVLVGAGGRAEPPGDRLAVEMHLELHAHRTVVLVAIVVVHC